MLRSSTAKKERPAARIMRTVEDGFNASVAGLLIACVCPSTQSAAICEIGGFLLTHRLRRLPQMRKCESLWLTTLYLKAKHQKQTIRSCFLPFPLSPCTILLTVD